MTGGGGARDRRQGIGGPPLPTNLYNTLADFSIFRCPMESLALGTHVGLDPQPETIMPNASQWNMVCIGGARGGFVLGMYISCFCVNFIHIEYQM